MTCTLWLHEVKSNLLLGDHNLLLVCTYMQLFADECATRQIFDEVLLYQRNVETVQMLYFTSFLM